jgi:hypothetical protein
MSLGAPVLDVQAQATGETVTSSTAVTIVSNGVVTAPGFDPIVITTSSSTSEDGRAIFTPNVTVYHSNTTIYRNISIADGDPRASAPKINQTATIVILVGSLLLLGLVAGCSIKYLYSRVYHDQIAKQEIHRKQLEITVGKGGMFSPRVG